MRVSKCSRLSLFTCGERNTQKMRRFVGSGTGPETRASVAFAASRILSHALCMWFVSKDRRRMRILDACTAACRTRTLSQSPSFVPPIIACASSPAPSRVRAQTANRTVWNKSTRAPPARDARAPPFTRARPRARRRPHREIRVTSHRLTHRLRRRRASLRLRRSKTTSNKNCVSHSSRVRAPSRASRAPPSAFASRRHSGFRRRLASSRVLRDAPSRASSRARREAQKFGTCAWRT